ncbi:peptidase [Paenibacillus sp. FSL H7-0326]|uniref:head maturation protease, ClpP-related n=1 Tax=Paenibacillus sp. FSL H7-0326 TaxID=1921144 RepID=UPI00096D75E3|nr:head maturation protease, ClpP-related [Paenibacillus sp. FSL H7-0326]OMC71358.1 peptidase [Paenibacillus sp. FSL H7-0326]
MRKIVNVKGVIVSDDEKWIYDWFDISATSPKSVADELKEANGEDVDVHINSGGGLVFAGSEIYSLLKSYSGKTNGKILGIAGSSASIAAMGCSHLAIAPTGQLMIHNAWTNASGDYRNLQHESDVLKNINASIANAYRLKTGLDEQEVLDMMDKETWFTAQLAVEKGFADEIMFDTQKQLAASLNTYGLLPAEVLEKMRTHLNSSKLIQDSSSEQKYKAKLNFLKLRGAVENE